MTLNLILPVKFLVSFLPLLLLISCGGQPKITRKESETKVDKSSIMMVPKQKDNLQQSGITTSASALKYRRI